MFYREEVANLQSRWTGRRTMFTDSIHLPNEKKVLSYRQSSVCFCPDRNGARIDDRGDYRLNKLVEGADGFSILHVGFLSHGESVISS